MVPESKVHPVRGVEAYALSPLQQGMLFHRVGEGSTGVDVEQCICELHEELDAASFERAWREAVSRHAILRTSFHWETGAAPQQVVHPATSVRLRFHHEEFGSEDEARRGLENFLEEDRREGFTTLDAPLLRVALLSAGRERHWWVVTFHHLLLDGRALVLLFKEVHELHDALRVGRPLDLPAAAPYRGYIDWLQTLDSARAEDFWREQFKGLESPTVLPVARAGTVEFSDPNAARGELAMRMTAAETDALREVAKRHQVTTNTLLQGAWALVLSRYTGEADVVFGAVRACRHIPVEGAATTIGMFINTVPIRVRVPAEATLGAWLQGLREQWVALRDFEHTPLMQVQQWSGVAPGRPLFETLFNYQEPSWDTALRQLGGAWATREFDIRSQPNYPLAVDGYGGANLLVKMLFDRRRFTDDVMARLLGHLRGVLESLVATRSMTSEPKIAAISMLSVSEQKQLLATWNNTSVDTVLDVCVHRLVETHAERSPEAIAVADAYTTLTYEQLNTRANRLARYLRSVGIGAEALVAVCMERSTEMLVAWLAALKAGAAFVPLDPKYPTERLAFQLEDACARAVITQPQLRPVLPTSLAQGTVIELGAGADDFYTEDESNLAGNDDPSSLAYVIYTSGSTGQPKGVQIEHRALMNLITWHQSAYGLRPVSRGSHLASPAFDASVWEIWPYLAAGASVHIPDEETRLSPAALWRWMAEQQITVAFVPTPLAEVLLHEPIGSGLALRALLTGGDKLKSRPSTDFPCALINHYGPTENTVVSTCGAVGHGDSDTVAPSIGRPIANTQCFILDAQQRLVPAGVPGELYVGGASLARGYWNRPELTAEKFVTVTLDVPRRLYRTGDLVRWTATGEIEFLGRIDNQVKIRGVRIELGEIEATLQQCAGVRESLVLALPDDRGQPQLVAYAIASEGSVRSERGVLEFLASKLPGHMVPVAVVFLEVWPLTPNGKIDRRALPAPAARGAMGDTAEEFHAPATPVEEAVAKVYGEILGREQVSRNDNFFDLGGHSLLAAQVVSRLNHALQAALTVRAVFEQPTVSALAREVETRRDRTDSAARSLASRVKRRTAAAARPEMEILQTN